MSRSVGQGLFIKTPVEMVMLPSDPFGPLVDLVAVALAYRNCLDYRYRIDAGWWDEGARCYRMPEYAIGEVAHRLGISEYLTNEQVGVLEKEGWWVRAGDGWLLRSELAAYQDGPGERVGAHDRRQVKAAAELDAIENRASTRARRRATARCREAAVAGKPCPNGARCPRRDNPLVSGPACSQSETASDLRKHSSAGHGASESESRSFDREIGSADRSNDRSETGSDLRKRSSGSGSNSGSGSTSGTTSSREQEQEEDRTEGRERKNPAYWRTDRAAQPWKENEA